MRDYIDITAKTEEEAIRKGLTQLGLDRDEVSVEVLERAKAGFLGFGSAPAKIRMSYGPDKPAPIPEPTPKPEKASASKAKAEREPSAAKPAKPEKPKNPEKRKPEAKAEKRVPDAKPEKQAAEASEAAGTLTESGEASEAVAPERRKRRKPRNKSAQSDAGRNPAPSDAQADAGQADIPEGVEILPVSAPAPEKARPGKGKRKPAPKSAPEQRPDAPAPESMEEVNDEKAQAIRAFLSGLLEHMDCPAEVRVYQPEEGRYKVILEGEGMGALIGRRGETLDAIQQLTNYSVNRNGVRVRIQLDAEGYREKREQSLQNLARKEAAKVVKYRRSRTLEPMNAYERHVIHTALQDFPGVNTYSTGVDPNRRVVIAFDRETV